MKIGIIILLGIFSVSIMYGTIIMVIKLGLFRNPFKDKWGRWKDDISMKEKFIWNLVSVMVGMAFGMALANFIF